MSSQYSKWWWLGYFGVQAWSVEERNVRITLGMTALVITIVGIFVVGQLLEWFGVDPHVAAPSAALLSLVTGFCSARPIATLLYFDRLQRADENARKRLSGSDDEVR
jgi:hypothetical protein